MAIGALTTDAPWMRSLPLVLLVGCTMDNGLTQWCTTEDAALDLEELSVLQDTFAIARGRDALALRYDGELPEGATWRVSQVDVLAALPRDEAATFEDGQKVTVSVWEGSDPTATEPWSLGQELDVEALTWEDAFLPDGDHVEEARQTVAWWSFDLRGILPEEGMEGVEYVVSVGWGQQGLPTLGYSNFELACDANWTDWGSGFSHNSTDPADLSCSWPMLRVHAEVREERKDCG